MSTDETSHDDQARFHLTRRGLLGGAAALTVAAALARPENRPAPRAARPDAPAGGPPPAAREGRGEGAADAVGDVVYGVAAVDGAFFVRTGTELICVRSAPPATTEGTRR